MPRIAVIGAGIAGLGAAYELQKSGCEVLLLESSGAVGGRMQTHSQDGFTWDAGAQFMLPTYTHMSGSWPNWMLTSRRTGSIP